jgi:oxygen-dependent protoporphyrinogen oxidase
MRRRFGGEAYDRLIEPLMSGIYGGNGDELSLLATFPQLRKLEREHGSVLRGVKRSSGRTSGPGPSPFVAPVEGMGALPDAIAFALDSGSLITGALAVVVETEQSGYTVRMEGREPLHARAVILATPAYVTAGLVSQLDVALSKLHAGIGYGSTSTVSLGFAPGTVNAGPLGHGYIIPRREGRPLMAVTFSSRKFHHRAPKGALLARGFIRVSGSDDLSSTTDGDLVSLVRAELRQTCGIRAEPVIAKVFRLPRSMPQYAVGHLDRLAAIDERLNSHPGLFVAGAAYRSVGIPDCITSGRSAADCAIAFTSGSDSATRQHQL